MGIAHERAERHAAVEGVEEITERAGEDAFDLEYLVAAGDEVAQRGHDRQARPDVGLVEEVLLAQGHLCHQRRVPAPGQRVGALVRRDDVKVGLDERGIRVNHRRVGRAVDQRGIRQFERREAFREALRGGAAS